MLKRVRGRLSHKKDNYILLEDGHYQMTMFYFGNFREDWQKRQIDNESIAIQIMTNGHVPFECVYQIETKQIKPFCGIFTETHFISFEDFSHYVDDLSEARRFLSEVDHLLGRITGKSSVPEGGTDHEKV